MPDQNCLIGKRFGKLAVIAIGEPYITTAGYPEKRMLCRCDCGKEKSIKCSNLIAGRSTSCGCKPKHVKHGHARRGQKFPRSYRIWRAMVRRCRDPKTPHYANYGGRGITVCERWQDFANFLADMGECPSEQHSIERKDNDKGYSKDNCKWATGIEQANNKRDTVRYLVRGVTGTLTELCRHFSVPHARTFARLKKSPDMDKAIFGARPNTKLTWRDVHKIRELKDTLPQKEIAIQFGISRSMVSHIHANQKWVTP